MSRKHKGSDSNVVLNNLLTIHKACELVAIIRDMETNEVLREVTLMNCANEQELLLSLRCQGKWET